MEKLDYSDFKPEQMFTVNGSNGEIMACRETGKILKLDCYSDYMDVLEFDVDHYKECFGELPNHVDIVGIGFKYLVECDKETYAVRYEKPEYDWMVELVDGWKDEKYEAIPASIYHLAGWLASKGYDVPALPQKPEPEPEPELKTFTIRGVFIVEKHLEIQAETEQEALQLAEHEFEPNSTEDVMDSELTFESIGAAE